MANDMLVKFLEDLESEISILNARRVQEVAHATHLLSHEGNSRHLGHNLGSVSHEIAAIDAKIEQTQMIFSDLQTRSEEAK